MANALGVRDESRINHDLNIQIEPTEFGHPRFVLAHPTAPAPNREDDERTVRSEKWLAYAADAIVAAAGRSNGRTLALCTSHADAAHIASHIGDRLTGRLFVRGPANSLKKTLDAAGARPDSVVLAAGAWQGLNRPRFFATGVITRLPFTPLLSFPREGQPDAPPTFSMWNMMRQLRQGLGRFIRNKDDAPEIWIVDPRIGLPASMWNAFRDGRIFAPHPQAQRAYLAAVPKRFLRALNDAELFLPESARPKERAKKKIPV
jgi:hypothetical protein